MNVDHIQFELRRRRLDEIFDFAITVLRNYPGLYIRFVLPALILFVALNTLLIWPLREDLGDDWESLFFSWPNLALFAVLIVEGSILRLPLLLINGRLLFQERVQGAEIRGDLRAVAGSYLGRVVILRNLLLLAFWPIFFLWPRSFFLPEVLALERTPGSQVRARLENLTRRQSDRILGFRLVSLLLGLLFLIIGAYVYSELRGIPGLDFGGWWFSAAFCFLSPVINLLFLVYSLFHNTARFLFYIDTRSVLEGWDLEKMLIKGMRESTGNR